MTDILKTKALSAGYGATVVVHNTDLTVGDGGITALLGANGAGKTTTLRAISNIIVRTRGAINFCDRRIDGMATEDIVRLGIAHVPDGRGTFTNLTTEENLRLGAYTRRDSGGVKADLQRMFSYFPQLCERRRQQAGTLSGGEQQMLAIARALMLRPKLLILDEPSFGLAPLVVRDIFRILKKINRDDCVSILLVEQNANMALELADRAFVMESGNIVMSGLSSVVAADERIKRSYLGI